MPDSNARLIRMEDKLDQVSATVAPIPQIQADIRAMKEDMHGSNGEPGLKVKVDRLEQDAARFKGSLREIRGVVWTALGGSATALVLWVWARVIGKTP